MALTFDLKAAYPKNPAWWTMALLIRRVSS